MNILVVSPVDPKNAAHNRLHDLLSQLSRNHHVDLVSTFGWWLKDDGEKTYDSNYRKGEIENSLRDINFEYLSEKRTNPIIQEFMPLIDRNRIISSLGHKEYDIIFNYNSILSGFLFSRMYPNVPMILDIADDLASMASDSPMVPRGLRSIVRTCARLLITLTIKESAIVTITTKSLADCYHIPEGKAIVLPNAVNSNHFRRIPSEKAKKRFGLDGRVVIGYVGVLREWVDFSMVIDALAKLKSGGEEPYLFIVGGEGDLREVMHHARTLGLEKQIVTTGTIPYDEVPEALSAMDIGLIPFKQNSVANNALPLKLFEYMSCAVPIISQRLTPIVDAVGDKVLYATTSTELSERLHHLISNPDIRYAMAQKGIELVAQRWNWDAVGEQLESLIAKEARRIE